MDKPEINTIRYYYWDLAWDYIKEKYNFNDELSDKDKNEYDEPYDLWNYICDTKKIHNGKIFTLTNWELVHNNGQFLYLVPKWYRPILEAFMEEFGEPDTGCLTPGTKPDTGCLTPGTKTANFKASW